MTFADLYHLNKKCEDVKEKISAKNNEPYIDENGDMNLTISITTYEDLKAILRDCEALIYDLCQTKVEDVIKRDS